MALQWMDNFRKYGAAAHMLDGFYAEVHGFLADDPDPSAVSSIVYDTTGQFSAGSSNSLRKVLSSTQGTVGVAMRNWLGSLPANNSQSKSVAIADGSNNSLIYTYITTTGVIQIKNGSGTVLGQSAGPVLVANAWQHVEIKAVIDPAVGSVEVRVEGVTVVHLTNINTGVGPAAQIRIDHYADGTSGSINAFIKDFAIWDGSGSHITDFVGTCSVLTLNPTSDVSLNWTPSTGSTGWNLIDEDSPDDTDYISAPHPSPAAAVFGLSNLPSDIVGIRGIMTVGRLRKSDSGDANIQMSMVSGSSTATGTDRPVTTAWTYWSDIFHVDPATGAAWTQAGVDAAQLQIDRTV